MAISADVVKSTSPPCLALKPREAAASLGISERSLWSLTHPRGPIRPRRLRRMVLYPVSELQRFLTTDERV